MSSGGEEANDEHQFTRQELKKRKIHRACDTCRRKKIRCDGGQMPNNRCSNCVEYNLECTYLEAARKRHPPKAYVENLENRLEKMEKLLQRLCPGADFTEELGDGVDPNGWTMDMRLPRESTGSPLIQVSHERAKSYITNVVSGSDTATIPVDPEDLAPSDDEYGINSSLTESFKQIAIDGGLNHHFHGKSSGLMLVHAAINMKKEFDGSNDFPKFSIPPLRRAKFWSAHPWELGPERGPLQFHYPPDDLIPSLVHNYFRHMNIFVPLLHRPSFERALMEKLHFSDVGFGTVVLLVCAVGARWSEDTRCLLDGENKHSAGWKWFSQVHLLQKNLIGVPKVYDLQKVALSAMYLLGSSSPQAAWMLVGVGIRLAQDIGAHRRKVYDGPLSVDSELMKRAFWVLLSIDRFSSAGLGRPGAIQDEDFDLDLPLEVDDEYLEHPDPFLACKQPLGKPSCISFFNSFLKLNQIMGFALRTLYSINKSKILLGFVGPQWEQHIVAELDSALNRWIDAVPDHLRWDPHREDVTFFNQSAFLYTTYYHVQILVHRPFISLPHKRSPLTIPSLVICTNAARSCSHILGALRRRREVHMPFTPIRAFMSGVVLLLNIWAAKKAGTFIDVKEQMADVSTCMEILRDTEEHMLGAGRLWDILNELASAVNIPMDKSSPPSNKRERGSDSPKTSNDSSTASTSDGFNNTGLASANVGLSSRPIAGRRNIASVGSVGFMAQNPLMVPDGSPAASATGGLSYATIHLARMNPLMAFTGEGTTHMQREAVDAGTTIGGMGVPQARNMIPSNSVPIHDPSLFASFPTSPSSTASTSPAMMPNTNTFDLFSASSPQQLYSAGNYFPNFSSDSGTRATATGFSTYEPSLGMLFDQYLPSTSTPHSDPSGSNIGGAAPTALPQMGMGIASIDEAIQMWSFVPTGFGLDDWQSYLNSVGYIYAADPNREQHSSGSSP